MNGPGKWLWMHLNMMRYMLTRGQGNGYLESILTQSDGDNPSIAVEEILKNPDKLRDLDLDAFAEELARQDYGDKRITLYDNRNELFEPFKEKRAPYVPISQVRDFLKI